MDSGINRGRCRGRRRAAQGGCTRTDQPGVYFDKTDDDPPAGGYGRSEMLEEAVGKSDESEEEDSTQDSEERKKKLELMVYKYMARQLISGLQDHRLEQIMTRYMNLNVDPDASPAAPPPSYPGSPVASAKHVASDQPSAIPSTSRGPVAVCETMSNSQPVSQVIAQETAANPRVAQATIPDIPKKHVYIGRGRGRGIRFDANKRL